MRRRVPLAVAGVVAIMGSPILARAQDAGPDAGDGGCGGCEPGLRCIDGLCGVCGDGEARDCDEGCGPGNQVCDYATRGWGSCDPLGEVECLIGDRRDCDHPCGPFAGGPGYRPCNPATCTFDGECLPLEPITCLPGRTASCVTPVNLCFGTLTCMDDCSFGECRPDPTVCNCVGGDPCCGNGARDPGECGIDSTCDADCGSESTGSDGCGCRAAPASSSGFWPLVLLVVTRRRMHW